MGGGILLRNAGIGTRPSELDAASIEPDLAVTDDRFIDAQL